MGSGGGYWWPKPDQTPAPSPRPQDKPTEDHLIHNYQAVRLDVAELEEMLGSPHHGLSDKELKRLDKSVVLMKAGAKVLKKVIRARGYRELKPAALREPA